MTEAIENSSSIALLPKEKRIQTEEHRQHQGQKQKQHVKAKKEETESTMTASIASRSEHEKAPIVMTIHDETNDEKWIIVNNDTSASTEKNEIYTINKNIADTDTDTDAGNINDNENDNNEEEQTGESEASSSSAAAVAAATTTTATMKLIRKGAVAAVGGTMTAVGLVMIPLPTPFGAVVASAGLGVLGTEFQEAKELNEKLIDGAKGHLNTARDAIVNGIERMNDDDDDPNQNRDDRDNNNNIYNDDNHDDGNNNKNHNSNNNTNASNTFMDTKVNCNNDANIDNSINAPVPDNHSTDTSDEENEEKSESEKGVNHTPTKNRNEDNDDTALPVWLQRNVIEQKRQQQIMKEEEECRRREIVANQTTYYTQQKKCIAKRTGKFLSRNVLPYIKRKELEEDEESNRNSISANTNLVIREGNEEETVANKEEKQIIQTKVKEQIINEQQIPEDGTNFVVLSAGSK